MSYTKAQQTVDAYHVLRKGFKWENSLMHHFGALLVSEKNAQVNVDRIKEVRKYIQKETGIFSSFRGMNEFMLAISLALAPNSEDLFTKTQDIYHAMKNQGFKGGTYLPMAAFVIAQGAEGVSDQDLITLSKDYYQGMKDHHKILTSQDDYVFAALLAKAGQPVASTIEKIEYYYKELSSLGLPKGNALQSLTHVLALSNEDPQEMVKRVGVLDDLLKKNKYKLRSYHMAFIGVLALISNNPDRMVADACDIADWLKDNKGYSGFSLDKRTRFIIAASILIQTQLTDVSNAVLATSIQAIIIAQQIAIAAAIAASTTAATSST